jgi:hypothetical protein
LKNLLVLSVKNFWHLQRETGGAQMVLSTGGRGKRTRLEVAESIMPKFGHKRGEAVAASDARR